MGRQAGPTNAARCRVVVTMHRQLSIMKIIANPWLRTFEGSGASHTAAATSHHTLVLSAGDKNVTTATATATTTTTATSNSVTLLLPHLLLLLLLVVVRCEEVAAQHRHELLATRWMRCVLCRVKFITMVRVEQPLHGRTAVVNRELKLFLSVRANQPTHQPKHSR